MRVPEACLDRLRDAGLLVSGPFVPGHYGYPDGVSIGKPATLIGNAIEGSMAYWGIDGPVVDAPTAHIHLDDATGEWVVTVHEYIPGPGPGDFVNRWPTPDLAVDDVVDFFLGDPARMDVKRRAEREALRRLDDDA